MLKAFASSVAIGSTLRHFCCFCLKSAGGGRSSSPASGGTLLKRGVFLPSAPQTSPQAMCSSRRAAPLLFGPLLRRTAKPLALALIFGLWTCVPVTTYAATTITKSIAAASDDAEEEGTTGTTPNRMWLNSSDIELVSDIEPASCGDQKIGLRFTAITIPAGATITDAYLNFRAIAADSPMTNSDVPT